MRYETIPSSSVWIKDSSSLSSSGRVAAMVASIHTGVAASAAPAVRPADLKPIDDLIALYEKAWSLMAKRNLVVDLNRAIAAWERRHPGTPPMAMAALKEVAERLLRAMPSARGYTNVICTGWAIGCNYKASTGVMSGSSVNNPDYFRHSTDDATDMAQKCGDMVTAVRAAKSAISVRGLTDNAQTLKIFMAPEFYFRGVNGAYAPEIVSEILPRLRTGLGAGWNDWLFVFGTAVASIEDEVTFCRTCGHGNSTIKFEKNPADRSKTIPKCDRDTGIGPAHVIVTRPYGAEVQNVALVYHAGESYTVAKEYVSGIDYTNGKVRVQPGTLDARNLKTLPPQGSTDSRIQSVFDDERMGGCILNIAGLTVGIEVCLDHIESATPSLGRASRYSGTIQILLIPSYGMSIGSGLYCRAGGVVFNVDGRGHGVSDMRLNGPGALLKLSGAVVGGRGSIDVWRPVPIPQ